MKWTLLLLIAACSAAYGAMDEVSRYAMSHGADAKYVYRVVDDEGRPVPDAAAHVSFVSYGGGGKNVNWIDRSDSNGQFVVAQKVNGKFGLVVGKNGYYRSFDGVSYHGMLAPLPVRDGKWQPYGEVRSLTLNKIRNPVPMRCFKRDYYRYPESGRWVGFDFERADWVCPRGNGVYEDVLVRFSEQQTDAGLERTMEAAFTNNSYGGVYKVPLNHHSEMMSPYYVDTNRVFLVKLTYRATFTAGRWVSNGLTGDECLVFRTRTKINANGELVSAHYGKIYGPWEFMERGGMSIGRIVFNPVVNDLNLEDEQTVKFSNAMGRLETP